MFPKIVAAIILALSPVCKTDTAPVILENISGVPILVVCHEGDRQETWRLDNYGWSLASNRRIEKVAAEHTQQ